MEKLTLQVSPQEWGHLITKYKSNSKKVTTADFTEGTINVETDSTGSLSKRKGGPNYNTTLLAAAPKDQFEAIFSDGVRHLLVVQSGEIKYSSGDTIFNTVVNGTGFSASGNFEFVLTQDRVYGGNGINSPQVYDRITSYGGVAYSAPRLKAMGAQAPSSAPTAGAPTAGGNVPNGAHTYKITFLYYDSEESNGSPASGVQTAGAGNNTIPLTAIAIGGYGVTARKIYRDNNDGLYLHIATLSDNTTTTFNDTINVGATPTEIPEFNNTPPSFSRITLWLDQLWVSGVPGDPSTLFYSDTDRPDIFNPDNMILCNQEDPITAHIVYYDRLIVFNRRSMGQILGKSSDTYRYAAIPSSVGCVDNRTLQIRVIEGVPILIWLSDRGFYSYDGNAINYISDEIEDLINFNIQQALQQRNSVSQSTFTGTAEDGISLTQVPGSITARGYLNGTSVAGTNPRRNWDDQGDWEGGTVTTNIRTKDGDGIMRVPTRFATTNFTDGTHSGTDGTTTLSLDTSIDFTGDSKSGSYNTGFLNTDTATSGIDDLATPFRVFRAGNLTSFSFDVKMQSGVATAHPRTWPVHMEVWNDVGGLPGSVIHSTVLNPTFPTQFPEYEFFLTTGAISVALAADTTYWFMIRLAPGQNAGSSVLKIRNAKITTSQYSSAGPYSYGRHDNGSWAHLEHSATNDPIGLAAGTYTFCATPVAASGIWTSTIYDTKSAYITTGLQINHTGVYSSGAFCSGTPVMAGQTIIEGSDIANFAGGAQITQTLNNVNGATGVSLSGKRYWRVKISLTTTDNRATPTAGLPILTFNTTATWESETVDCTAQVTTYNSLATTSTTPAGTSVTTTIATSTSPSGPWTFVSFGSHVVRQYARIRVTSVASTGDIDTPTVSAVVFKWTISAKYTSTIIDTGVNPPAGWDLFLSEYATNGGTATFEMRSATTSGGIPAATFFTVTPGDFPALVTPNQFTQWRVTIVASDEDVPQIDSVTIQWFISNVASLRPASLFVDGRYYVSLAEVGSLVNNVLLQIDLNGKWRRLSGLNIATFSFFFNRPYFGLASSGQIRKFLEGNTDAGVAIEFDWRTKAFDYSTQYQNNSSKVKVVGEVILEGTGTGATYQLFYSVDSGETFIPMITSFGSSTYTSTNDGQDFFVRWRPVWDGSNDIDGRTIMYRLYNNDTNEVDISGISPTAFLRKQSPVITG